MDGGDVQLSKDDEWTRRGSVGARKDDSASCCGRNGGLLLIIFDV